MMKKTARNINSWRLPCEVIVLGVLEANFPLWGHWNMDAQIGSGAHGNVYQVSHDAVGAELRRAVRHIPVSHQATLDRLIEDLTMCARLRNIKTLLCYDEHLVLPAETGFGCELFLRMDLAESLASRMARSRMTEAEIVQLGLDIAEALHILEANGLPHRNVKPSNLFAAENGHWRLGDLVLARRLGLQGDNNPYTAPEVAAGIFGNQRADIFSLGMVLFTLCNENLTPVGLPHLPPANASPRFAHIILKACASEPKNRYPSAAALADALQTLLPKNAAETAPNKCTAESITDIFEDESMEEDPDVVTDCGADLPVNNCFPTEKSLPKVLTDTSAAELEMSPILENLSSSSQEPAVHHARIVTQERSVSQKSRRKPLIFLICLGLVTALLVLIISLMRQKDVPVQAQIEVNTVADKTSQSKLETVPEQEPAPIQSPKPEQEPTPEPEPEPVRPQEAEYIMPNSNQVYLTYADFEDLTWEQCGLAKNEIYARHGRLFTNEGLLQYFEAQSWYEGTIPAEEFQVNEHFSDIEMYNADLLNEYEIKTFGYACQDFSAILSMSE